MRRERGDALGKLGYREKGEKYPSIKEDFRGQKWRERKMDLTERKRGGKEVGGTDFKGKKEVWPSILKRGRKG